MKSYSAKELKNHTGEILRQVGSGQRVLITKHGKPHAVLSPVYQEQLDDSDIRSFEEAWADIEQSLRTTQPQLKTWQEAMQWTRRRS